MINKEQSFSKELLIFSNDPNYWLKIKFLLSLHSIRSLSHSFQFFFCLLLVKAQSLTQHSGNNTHNTESHHIPMLTEMEVLNNFPDNLNNK